MNLKRMLKDKKMRWVGIPPWMAAGSLNLSHPVISRFFSDLIRSVENDQSSRGGPCGLPLLDFWPGMVIDPIFYSFINFHGEPPCAIGV